MAPLASLLALAQAPAYVTRPSTWKLELKQVPGGWTSQRRITAQVKVVDPTDPDPPREEAWGPVDSEVEDGPTPARPNRWPQRPEVRVLCWFNGERKRLTGTLGYALDLDLEAQNGENRLEVRLPESGQRRVQSWFTLTSRDRLLIRMYEPEGGEDFGWWGGGLQVVEPDHTESIGWEPTPSGGKNRGDSYLHPSPLPGTYTVRWFDSSQGVEGYEWGGDGYGGNRKPKKVRVDVVLDPGTEQERRWSFERLVIPGTRRVTLGSFDIEG